MFKLLLIALGGAAGTLARYGTATALRGMTERAGFPVGTLVINLAGCFLLGVVNTVVLERGVPDAWRLAVGVGFCGAFTTFSTFGFETLALLREGRYAAAALYVVGSNMLGLVAATLGWLVARA